MSEIQPVSTAQEDGRIVLGTMMFLDAIKGEYTTDEATAAVQKWMKDHGVKTLEVKDESGKKIGTLSLSEDKKKPVVTDLDKLTAWVERTHPEHIVTKPAIRGAFLAKLLADASEEGTPVDTATGEVPPGIEMRDEEGRFSRRPDKAAKQRMTALVRESVIPALPALAQPDPGRWTQEELDAARARAQEMVESLAPITEEGETPPEPTRYSASDFDDYRTT